MTAVDVAIVGGGASGVILAAHLLRGCDLAAARLALIDDSGRFGRGVAYGTDCPHHLLNVPAGRMSAWPDDPLHFLRWAQQRDASVGPHDFLPRPLYGAYLQALLADASRGDGRLRLVVDRAVGLRPGDGGGVELWLASGERLASRRVVLALGNAAPGAGVLPDARFAESRRYVSSAWSAAALADLRGDESMLLLGSGLTAVDVVAELAARRHAGTVHAVSRHGLLPAAHGDGPIEPAAAVVGAGRGVGEALRALRVAARAAMARGEEWRGVFDGVRPVTQAVWRAWSADSRRQFLRHARAFWDVHRHRVAPRVAGLLEEWLSAGRLVVHAGRLRAVVEAGAGAEATVVPRGGGAERVLRVERVINCTGPATDVARSADPLVRSLVAGGLMVADGLGLGPSVDVNGALIGRGGAASAEIFAIGPLCRAEAWECTAVPDIRVAAAELAERLAAKSRTVGA
ncbi:MAG: FAD/NAD(P)-binding protein [Phycisphaerae bacterium]